MPTILAGLVGDVLRVVAEGWLTPVGREAAKQRRTHFLINF